MRWLQRSCWVAALLMIGQPISARAACDAMLASSREASIPRPIVAADLIGLRDIGVANALAADSPLSISPDGRQVAFVVTHADAAQNRYCFALVVLALKKGAIPRIINQGGEPIRAILDVRGLRVIQGYLRINRPVWSPDGRWLAYLRREHGVTQIWRVASEGGIAEPVTIGTADVERFAWTSDGLALIVSRALESEQRQSARVHEALAGYAYDDRFVPSASSRPLESASSGESCERIDVDGQAIRTATPAECSLVSPPLVANTAERAILEAREGHRRAWTEQAAPDRLQSPIHLFAEDDHGIPIRCAYLVCIGSVETGIEGIWWSPKGDVLFLRREGWGRSRLGLYRWRPGRVPPTRLLATEDLLMGCEMGKAGLLCARDASTRPRRLVLIDPVSGASSLLFDPNPEFAAIRLGQVTRLRWRNAVGFECYGDLVLPPGHKPGQRHPLIVVQYITRGFLRGGTGDEYPIQLFAARGYAVLSVQAPPSFYESLGAGNWRDFREAEVENMRDWRDRRSIFSALVEGIRTVERMGVIDPKRIGLTGLSDGATTTQYALVNSKLFAAAAISSCCVDAQAMMIYGGTRLARDRMFKGYADATQNGASFWRPISLALNADKIDAPLLMQLPDEEFLGAIDSVTSLENAGKPVSLYVFPDENHTKWEPAHRLAVYTRNLDWFDFWLMGKVDPDPAKRDQYNRWSRLRERWRRKPKSATIGSVDDQDHARAQASTSAKVMMRR
jgi:dipeptidyl aminopeptidase/acylaminoacyl peptidase